MTVDESKLPAICARFVNSHQPATSSPRSGSEQKHASTPTSSGFTRPELGHRRWNSDEDERFLKISAPVLTSWGSQGMDAPSTPVRGGVQEVSLVRTPSEAVRKYFAKAEKDADAPLPKWPMTSTPPRPRTGSSASDAPLDPHLRQRLSPHRAPIPEGARSASRVLRPSPGRPKLFARATHAGELSRETIPEGSESGSFASVSDTSSRAPETPDTTVEDSPSTARVLPPPTSPFLARLLDARFDTVPIVSLDVGGTVFATSADIMFRTPSKLSTWLRNVVPFLPGDDDDDAGYSLSPYRRPSDPGSHFSLSTVDSSSDENARPQNGRIVSLHPTLHHVDDDHLPDPDSPLDAFFRPRQPPGRPLPPVPPSSLGIQSRRPSSEYSAPTTPTPSRRRRPSTIASTAAFPTTATSSMFPGSDLGHPTSSPERPPMPQISLDSLRLHFEKQALARNDAVVVGRVEGVEGTRPLVPKRKGSLMRQQPLSPMRMLTFGDEGSSGKSGQKGDAALQDSIDCISPRQPDPSRRPFLPSQRIEVFIDRDPSPYPPILHFLRRGDLPRSLRFPTISNVPVPVQTLVELHIRLAQVKEESEWLGLEGLRSLVEKEVERVEEALRGDGEKKARASAGSAKTWI